MKIIYGFIVLGWLLSACTPPVPLAGEPEFLTATPLPAATEGDSVSGTPADAPLPGEANQALPTATPTLADPPPAGAAFEFSTDFSRHTVPYAEILSGGPPKDGIPAIDKPKFIPVSEADEFLAPVEPVILVQVGDDARAYPLQILTWHEIVNDTVGGLPLLITFCPLCNTAIIFERTVDGQVLDFGTTGRLRYSNLIMYDRQTESWWQQATGEAIVGSYVGTKLKFYPGSIIAWDEFKTNFPRGQVLSRDTGYFRPYGTNPYIGYDDVNRPPFAYRGPETPGALLPVAYVLTIDAGEEAVAYPYETLEQVRVVNDVVGGQDIVVFWQPGTASALDRSTIAAGRDIGSARAYSRRLGEQVLTFQIVDGKFIDQETGSEWTALAVAQSGELAGARLDEVIAINHFWFSWAAFKPDTRIHQP